MKIVDPDGNRLQAGEVGEICGRGPTLMQGYYKRPDLTQRAIRDGWLHSGDFGCVDEDGFLYLVDRVNHMMLSGGSHPCQRGMEEVAM
jgi:acyl-CoA synthetase (AMP-forming)/AMP-acid ligase II